jgi:uncharacterized protein (TIGR00369 family)
VSDGGDDAAREAVREVVREAFEDVPLHRHVGLRLISAGDEGPAVMEIPLTENALGRTGQLHGAAVALLCDVTCAAAASSASTYDFTTHALVTADLHVRYLGPARGDTVRCEAAVVKAGRTLIVVQGQVTDSDGGVVAVADFAAMLVERREPLTLEG